MKRIKMSSISVVLFCMSAVSFTACSHPAQTNSSSLVGYVTFSCLDTGDTFTYSDVDADSSELAAIELSYRWGELEREYLEKTASGDTGTPAIVGEHFTISFDYLSKTVQVQSWIDSDPDVAESHAKKILVEKYSLYYQAQEADVVVSNEYLDRLIDENIATFEEAMSSNPQYTSFLDGIGMTNEEYWYSCKDNLRMTESIAAWKDYIYDEFIKENGYDVDPPNNLGMLWNAYYDDLVENIIAQENIQYFDVAQ